MTGQAEVMSAGCTLNNAVQKSGSGKSLGRVVGIALRSEAAALWFDAEVIIHGPLNSLFAAEIPFAYNALPFLVTYGVSSALSRRFATIYSCGFACGLPTIREVIAGGASTVSYLVSPPRILIVSRERRRRRSGCTLRGPS